MVFKVLAISTLVAAMAIFTSACTHQDRIRLVAEGLARSRFDGWVYGSESASRQVDCVQFLVAVLEEALSRPLTNEERSEVLIANIGPDENLDALVDGDDVRVAGVQHALLSRGLGHRVEAEDAAPGDFLQYWYKTKSGRWGGHAAVIWEVRKTERGSVEVQIFGAHQSLGRVGVAPYWLNLSDQSKKVYLARMAGASGR
ncbi:MAG: hypothetical protein JNK49_01335 [Planctomycetes bacterium]|nr:hypothetical protein [Planctomycetota bacterium]